MLVTRRSHRGDPIHCRTKTNPDMAAIASPAFTLGPVTSNFAGNDNSGKPRSRWPAMQTNKVVATTAD